MQVNLILTDRQVEELGKLLLDLGKLVFASLVLGFFQSDLSPATVMLYGLLGLIFSATFFIVGIRLLKEADGYNE